MASRGGESARSGSGAECAMWWRRVKETTSFLLQPRYVVLLLLAMYGYFASQHPPGEPYVFTNSLRESTTQQRGEGHLEKELVGQYVGLIPAKRHSISHLHLDPGASTQRHKHRRMEESWYVLEGTASLAVDGTVKELRPGDVALIRPGYTHKLFNGGKSVAKLIQTCSPPYDERFVIPQPKHEP